MVFLEWGEYSESHIALISTISFGPRNRSRVVPERKGIMVCSGHRIDNGQKLSVKGANVLVVEHAHGGVCLCISVFPSM